MKRKFVDWKRQKEIKDYNKIKIRKLRKEKGNEEREKEIKK